MRITNIMRRKNVRRLVLSCIVIVLLLPSLSSSMIEKADSRLLLISNEIEDITLQFDFQPPRIEQIEGNKKIYQRITIRGLPNSGDLLEPRLPVKSVKLLIPYDHHLDSIEVVGREKTLLGSGCNVERGHNIIPITTQQSHHVTKQKTHKKSPEILYSILSTHIARGYHVVFVNLYPVHYQQDTGEISYYPQMILTMKTKESPSNTQVRGLQKDKQLIEKLVDNPTHISTYDNAVTSISKDTVDYVIITNEDLASTSGDHTFQDLIQSKLDKGLSAEIVTVEDIESNPDYWVNGEWGDNNPANPFYGNDISSNPELFNDTQAKIRNFIRYAYTELGTEYVLLGGDADVAVPGDNIIPLRGLYATEEGLPLYMEPLDFEEDDIPSDVYYACLDGNFNYDMDIHWGENETLNNAALVDEADLLCEVYVGRACVDAEDEVSNFVMKTITYDNDDEDPYLTKALMVGEYLGFPGVSQWGGNYKDLIIPLIPDDFFTVETLYERDTSWNKYTIMNILNNDPPHLINHLGHGNQNYALKMYNSDILTLTNDKYFFIYSQTCLAGSFDNWNPWGGYQTEDSAAEHFTVETPHGAFAVIMNARYGLGSEDTLYSPSQILDESFFSALFTENLRQLGKANHYSKEDHIWHIDENGIRWVYYETNLFGDPELQIKPKIDEEPPTTTLSYTGTAGENDWYIGSGNIVLTATDYLSPINVTYYKINDGDWEIYAGPFAFDEEGLNIFNFYSVDMAGNEESIQTDFVKIDLSNPTVLLTKQTISENEVKFTAHITDDVSGGSYAEFYQDDELQYTDYESPYEWIWEGTGRHTFQAKGYDIAGNQGTSNEISISNQFSADSVIFQGFLQKMYIVRLLILI